MSKTTKQTKWEERYKSEKTTPKFMRTGAKVIVNASFEPFDTKVLGRYGERKVYVVDTTDYGLIYVSSIQFLHICDVLRNANYENVTVEL